MIKYQVMNKNDMDGRFMGVKYFNNGIVGQITSHGFSYLDARSIYRKDGPIGLETLPIDIIEMGFEATGKINKDLERILNMLHRKNKLENKFNKQK